MSGSGSDLEKDFFEAVGRALVAWQRVEGRLVGIYLLLLGSPGTWGAAGAAFYCVFAVPVKVAMIKEASRWGRLNGFPALLDELDKLLKKISKTARKRNHLVHLEGSEIDSEWMIGDPMWDARMGDKKYYATKDIVRWANEFDELYKLLLDFSHRIPSDKTRARVMARQLKPPKRRATLA